MARKEIIICDRCGKEFKPIFQVVQDVPVLCDERVRNKKLYQLRYNDLQESMYFYNIDLCYGCYKELVDWFERGEMNE